MRDAARLVQSTIGVAPTDGNRVTVLRNGDEIFPAMLAAIKAAEDSIELTTYVYWTGDIADRFARQQPRRGRAGRTVGRRAGARGRRAGPRAG